MIQTIVAKEVTSKLVDAMRKLIPQLTQTKSLITKETLGEIVYDHHSELIILKDNEDIIGALALIVYTIPTGKKAFIEDVIVDEKYRGKGLGEKILTKAIDVAKDKKVKRIELSSRPLRVAANKLYQKMGFVKRDTNFYRLQF